MNFFIFLVAFVSLTDSLSATDEKNETIFFEDVNFYGKY